MIKLADVIEDARRLSAGRKVNVKFALWLGCLTANASIAETCEQARRLRPYARRRLPQDSDKIVRLLAGTGLTTVKLRGLYHVQGLADSGALRGLETLGATYSEQLAWRDRVWGLCHGHGFALKTISMAALLIDPLHCELVPVDRHVLARLGLPENYTAGDSRPAIARYLEVEQFVHHERDGHAWYISAAVEHWLLWARWIAAKYPDRATLESHAPLTCRY